ncbi:hypothetical protein Tco_0744173 [Tanacetum coccineum]
MVSYLEKTDVNVEFHEIIDFLTRSSIHYALTLNAEVVLYPTGEEKNPANLNKADSTVNKKPKDGNSDESAAPTTVFRDDETIAQFLVTMSQNKTNQKGFVIKEIKDTNRPRTTTESSILTLKPLPKIDPKDKGKKEKKKLVEEEATKAALIRDYDDIHAKIEADSILVARLQEEEREKFIIKERAKLLHATIVAQRRFLAQQRAAEIRKEAVLGRRKLGHKEKREMKSRKRRFRHGKSEDEKENDELNLFLTIAPDEDKEVDYEILDKKYPIKEWTTENLGIKTQFDETKGLEEINLNVVIRSNGQRRYFSTLIRVLLIFDREDLNAVYKLVMDRYQNEAAIKSRFGGNEESKKMQKNVLKHQFENFTTASNESLDKAYDRFQKLISQLEVHGAPISKEYINQKFLRSLPTSWNQISLIMRNKPDIDEIDIDDIYNNLSVYEDEMKRSSSSTSTS